MDLIRPFWTVYNLFDRLKNNEEQCPHVLQRLKALETLALFILEKEPEQLSDDVNEALSKLKTVLQSAAELIGKFNKSLKVTQVVKSSDFKLEFENLNKSLTDSYVSLSGVLHVHQGKKLDKQEKKLEKQEIRLSEQKNMLAEQEKKLAEQEKKLAEQEDKLARQEDVLERVESKLLYESKSYYCVLQ